MISSQTAIVLDQLRFSYAPDQPVLNIPHWQVMRGDKVFLYGPSGCGKSTLLNILSGFLHPSSGQVSVLGQSIENLSGRRLDKFRARHIGTVCQQFNLVPYLSVLDNILLAAHFAAGNRTQTEKDARQLLDALQLPVSILKQTASTLSVGQQQRVAIARALINHPELLIVDEPTSALDYRASLAFMSLLHSTADTLNSTLIFVSHDERLAASFDTEVSLEQLNQLETVYDY